MIFTTLSGSRLSYDTDPRPGFEGQAITGATKPAIQAWLDDRYPVPAPPPKYATLDSALAAMTAFVESIGPQLRGYVPTDERDSWAAKLEEAAAYIADNNSPTPIMDAEVALTSEAVAALASVVVAKGAAYKTYAGQIAGLRRATKAALEAVSDPNGYEAILKSAQAQAEALLPGA